MIEQLYRRISGFFAIVMMIAFALTAGANADDQGADKSRSRTFLNYDMVMGDKNAPIEIIEYASTVCPHCASFHSDVLPELKKKYIDTGKVKLVFRNFVSSNNPFDVFAAMTNRCVAEKKFFPLLGLYFKRQQSWVKYKEFSELKPYGKYAALGFAKGEAIKIAKIAGMKEAEAYQCLARTEILKFLMDVNAHARTEYDLNATPTIIVNGKKVEGYQFEAIEKAILAVSE